MISIGDNILQAIQGLDSIASRCDKSIVWVDEDPYAVDSIRGTIMTDGWRGTITEYCYSNPTSLDWILDKTRQRLVGLLDIAENVRLRPRPYYLWRRDGGMGFGTYGWNYKPDVVVEAMRGGVTLIDTAETYGYGRVERELGVQIKEYYKLAKKLPAISTKVSRNHLSNKAIKSAFYRSVNTLGRVDLYHVHRLNMDVEIKSVIEAVLSTIAASGAKLGVSNFSWDMVVAADFYSGYTLDVVQVRYNLLDRGIERALIPLCQELGITILAYSPLGQEFYRIVKADTKHTLRDIALKHHLSTAQVVANWVSNCIGVLPIYRTNNVNHLAELLDISKDGEILLTPEDTGRIEDAFRMME